MKLGFSFDLTQRLIGELQLSQSSFQYDPLYVDFISDSLRTLKIDSPIRIHLNRIEFGFSYRAITYKTYNLGLLAGFGYGYLNQSGSEETKIFLKTQPHSNAYLGFRIGKKMSDNLYLLGEIRRSVGMSEWNKSHLINRRMLLTAYTFGLGYRFLACD